LYYELSLYLTTSKTSVKALRHFNNIAHGLKIKRSYNIHQEVVI